MTHIVWYHLYEISLSCPPKERVNLEGQKIDLCFSGAGSGMGVTANGRRGSFWNDINVLKVDFSDGCTTL